MREESTENPHIFVGELLQVQCVKEDRWVPLFLYEDTLTATSIHNLKELRNRISEKCEDILNEFVFFSNIISRYETLFVMEMVSNKCHSVKVAKVPTQNI